MRKTIVFIIVLVVIFFAPIVTIYLAGGIPFVPDKKIRCEETVCWYPIKTTIYKYVVLKFGKTDSKMYKL